MFLLAHGLLLPHGNPISAVNRCSYLFYFSKEVFV